LLGLPRSTQTLVFLLAGWALCQQMFRARAAEPLKDPDAACAPCHRDIYQRYRGTPMARASGPAVDGVIPADFSHPASGVHYRVFTEGGKAWMTYDRKGTATPGRASTPLHGRIELRFYIGSGKRGRTFLFQRDGYWFEAPINWYAKKHLWDMTPNHLSDREMPLTMPVDPGCLHCHASGVAASLPDARNHYLGAPFASGGIHCAGCHGDPSAHLASKGKAAMVNLDTLEPVRRDSVCLNCHLEGQTAVDRLGKRPEDFRPGDNLFDYADFFVFRSENGSGGRATSQWEALLQSQCKKQSGDRLTCTTCHDPHGSPPADKRVMFYRQRCLQCHNQPGFVATHHPGTLDCTACHMARTPSSDIAHAQVTDHLIRKRIPAGAPATPDRGVLETVGPEKANDRDLGLAYAQMAERGDRDAAERAMDLLRRAEKDSAGAAPDPELHGRLGFLEQVSGHPGAAAKEYEQAVAADPYNSLALGDLALIRAEQHQYAAAERLWKAAFEHDPVQIGAGLNLAIVECETGNSEDAVKALKRVLEFAPDNAKAYELLYAIESGKHPCDRRARTVP
jgi:predicted CXXCH cytochrome family protein